MNELIDFLSKDDVKNFIEENLNADSNKLILNPPLVFKARIKEIARQILARQKAKSKLVDWANNFNLIMPPPLSIEQASSLASSLYKQQLIKGERLIDLTGGMGIDFLAISKQFSSSTYVEREVEIFEVFRYNASQLSSKSEIINSEASEYLKSLNSTPSETVIYLDPARRDAQKSKVFKVEDCSPNLIDLLPILKQKAQRIWVKYSPMLDIHSILHDIPEISEIHIVSVRNDCKELLLNIDFTQLNKVQVHCINLETNQPPYTFLPEEEKVTSSLPVALNTYLYEPNSSILKAGAFKKIASDFTLGKLAEHTHLYTSEVLINGFPGKIFKVLEEVDKKNIRAYTADGKINVTTRNYPLSSNELKKKWNLRDGGDYFLIGFRDFKNKPRLIIADRIDDPK